MNKSIEKIKRSPETYLLITVIALFIFIQIRSGIFFSNVNIVDMLRAYIVPGMFACGVLVVLISGGTDVSFPALSTLTIYLTTKFLDDIGYTGSFILPLIMCVLIGGMFGAINGFIIAKYRLPTLIVTLGTQSIFWGILHGVFKATEIAVLPKGMAELSEKNIFSVYNSKMGIGSDLPIMFFFLIAIIVVVWFLLNRTMIGRGIYAIGGDIESAERVGFNVFWIQMFVYVFMGAIAGVTGFTRTVVMSSFHPNSMTGIEMNIIAMVVLGGARLSGGTGSVKGAIIGAVLITTMSNSLQLLGIPIYWQKVFTGIIIIIGIGISAYQSLRQQQIPNATGKSLKSE